MEEIFDFVLARIHESGLSHQLAAGVVLTGGCTELYGSEMLAQRTFRLPVSKGLPRGYTNDGFAREVTTASHATAIGLALYSVKHHHEFLTDSFDVPQPSELKVQAPSSNPPEVHVHKKGMAQRLKDWFENF
jgi:cell division ATPase FtsA